MNEMVRKNIHVPDALVKVIGDVWHSARFRSETATVVALLEGALDRLAEADGYVYLVRGPAGLKIGYSQDPRARSEALKGDLLCCISGDRLTELAAHTIWGRHRLQGEWFSDEAEIVKWFETHPLKVDAPEKKHIRLAVLFTQAERDRLQAAADKMGVGLSTFIRIKALESADV